MHSSNHSMMGFRTFSHSAGPAYTPDFRSLELLINRRRVGKGIIIYFLKFLT